MLKAERAARPAVTSSRQVQWVEFGAAVLALLVLLREYRTVIEGSDWMITGAVMISLMTGTCVMLRQLGARWVAPVAFVVEVLALAWIFVPATMWLILPTPSTATALVGMFGDASRLIVDEKAPVAPAAPIVFFLVGAFGLLVIVADFLLATRRAVPLLGITLIAVFITPAMIAGVTPSAWTFVIVAALWMVVLRTRTATQPIIRTRDRLPAAILGAAALVVSVSLPPVLPDITAVAAEWGKPPPTVFGRGINPMLQLGQNLRRNSSSVALTYTTSRSTAPYLKVATLTDFRGKTWRPVDNSDAPGRFESRIGVDSDIEAVEDETTIKIASLKSSMLPVPYPALSVSGLKGSWRLERLGTTIRSDTADTQGQEYTITSLTLKPTAEQMRGLTTFIGSTLQPYVELPAFVPPIIGETAREVTQDADNDYDRAMALQRYFRTGAFRYSETAPVAQGFDGNGVEVIAKFLEEKRGYCVHFSSAMAVMARAIGIPSRIAVGYAPGVARDRVDGKSVYEVTTDDLHAWTEIYFDGVGWTRFDPTPSVGAATSFTDPTVAPNPDEVPDFSGVRPDTTNPGGLENSPVVGSQAAETAPRTVIVALAGFAFIVAIPGLLRRLRRWWRLRKGSDSPDPLWRELEDTARDFGLPHEITATPRGFAAGLRLREGIDIEALDALLSRVERSRYARPAGPDDTGIADLEAVIASIGAGSSRFERLRATVVPTSLLGQRRFVAEPSIAG